MACLLRFWSRLRTPRPGDPEHPEVEKNQPGKPKKDGKRWKLKSLRKIFRRKKKVTGEGEEAAAAEDHRSLIQPEHEADDAHQGTGNLEVETHDEVVKGLDGSRDHLLEYETLKVLETKSEHLRKRIKFLLEKNEKQIELKSVRAEVETLQKKKRVRRGTRGRGRKIHYRKREEEEPETGDVRQPQTGEAGEETQQVMKVEEEKKVMDVVMETEEAEAEACYEQPLAEESRVKFLDEAKDESLQKKKRVRRGTRGRGRKIHYRKREEEEPETGDVRQPQTGEAGEETQQIMKVEEEKKVMDMVMETEEAEAEACYEQPLAEESRVKLLDEAKDESLQKKKRVRRGTRGRGRKIHYRKREEEEPETGDVRQPQTGEAGEETQQIMKVEEEKKVMDVVMETEEAEACYEQPLAEESRVKFLDEAKDEGLQKKKKVKRGTRGRGQKIHYRKREEEEPETGDVRQPQTGEAGEKTQQIMKVEEEKKVMDVVMETEEAEACYEQPLAEAKTTYWYGAGTNHWYHQHYQQPYYQQPPPATYWYGQIDTGAGTNHWCHQYYQQPYYQQPPPATYWYGQMDTGKGTTYWYNHDQQHPQATYWYGPENSGNQWCQW